MRGRVALASFQGVKSERFIEIFFLRLRRFPRSSDCAPDPCEEDFLPATASDSTARARSQVIGDELRAGEGRTLEEQEQEVFQYQIKTLTGLQYDQAKQISKFVKAQVWIVNIFVLIYVAVRVLKGEWPSDKLLLGWFASVVVEVIGLYIIVLKGIFDAANFGSHLSRDMRGKG